MAKNIPLIVVHKGKQDYLKACISSIEEFHDLFLLGNDDNKSFTKHWVDFDGLKNHYFNDFDAAYEHMSTNSPVFEKICFYRYLAMYEFAKHANLDEFIHCDSDIIILNDCRPLFNKLPSYGAAFFIPKNQENYRLTASPHFSYWKTDVLKEFIEFFIKIYAEKSDELTNKYNYHVRNNIPGGICDMTLLYLFAQNRSDIFNFIEEDNYYLNFNVSTLEHNELNRNELIFNDNYKVINGELYYNDNGCNKKVLLLHMQGRAKKFVKYAKNKKFRKLFICISLLNLLRKINNKL
ncbi:hypothetical protein [Pseudenterobacter timonensis]|uniref:Uncharacterized protein n=1 Tax=Pseudenterobacter timonensis TaxID=1755099 RepID=A0ABV4A132_9ENTR